MFHCIDTHHIIYNIYIYIPVFAYNADCLVDCDVVLSIMLDPDVTETKFHGFYLVACMVLKCYSWCVLMRASW